MQINKVIKIIYRNWNLNWISKICFFGGIFVFVFFSIELMVLLNILPLCAGLKVDFFFL